MQGTLEDTEAQSSHRIPAEKGGDQGRATQGRCSDPEDKQCTVWQ